MLSYGKAQEGENVFSNGSMTGIAITLFIKNPNVSGDCKIYYHDIGNNFTTKEKLTALEYFGSIDGITSVMPIYKMYHIASALLSLLKLIKRNVNDKYDLNIIYLNERDCKLFSLL
ncbi:hypothetical protein AAFS14_06570 [Bartonella schoenbuchensis]